MVIIDTILCGSILSLHRSIESEQATPLREPAKHSWQQSSLISVSGVWYEVPYRATHYLTESVRLIFFRKVKGEEGTLDDIVVGRGTGNRQP